MIFAIVGGLLAGFYASTWITRFVWWLVVALIETMLESTKVLHAPIGTAFVVALLYTAFWFAVATSIRRWRAARKARRALLT
jgi:hypothetical protein